MKTAIYFCACIALCTVALNRIPANPENRTTKVKLEQEYKRTQEQVRLGKEHLLRLEGAIAILEHVEAQTSESEKLSSATATGN